MDRTRRAEQLRNVHSELASIEQWFERVLTHPLNPQSNPQMKALFYDDLRCPEQYTGKGDSRRLTCDDEALSKINRARPYLSALIQRCQDYRTLAVLGGKATAANRSILTCRLDEDNRLRTTLNLCGAETFRYSSGPTAHGTGCNVQNILKVRE
jgi:DNA polymerase I-like protein with 3'-5' exonuclease and polymerase domains